MFFLHSQIDNVSAGAAHRGTKAPVRARGGGGHNHGHQINQKKNIKPVKGLMPYNKVLRLIKIRNIP